MVKQNKFLIEDPQIPVATLRIEWPRYKFSRHTTNLVDTLQI
jgi:hypothetical protein